MSPDVAALEVDKLLADAEQMAELLTHPAWAAMESLLGAMRNAALEELAQCGRKDVGYWQGVAAAAVEFADRPRRIIAGAEAIRREEEDNQKVIRPSLRAMIGTGVDRDGDI